MSSAIHGAKGGDMSKKADDRPANKPRRYRAARIDGTVGALKLRIAKVFDLPRGSIKIVGPNGRGKRSDATVGSLLAEWNGGN